MYQNGFGVSQDFSKAMDYYKLASDKGDSSAKFELGNDTSTLVNLIQMQDSCITMGLGWVKIIMLL